MQVGPNFFLVGYYTFLLILYYLENMKRKCLQLTIIFISNISRNSLVIEQPIIQI